MVKGQGDDEGRRIVSGSWWLRRRRHFLVLTWQSCHGLFLVYTVEKAQCGSLTLFSQKQEQAWGSSPDPCRNQIGNSTYCSALQLQILNKWMQSQRKAKQKLVWVISNVRSIPTILRLCVIWQRQKWQDAMILKDNWEWTLSVNSPNFTKNSPSTCSVTGTCTAEPLWCSRIHVGSPWFSTFLYKS